MRIVFIGSAADGVRIMLIILMSHRESYRVITVIRVNGTLDVVTVDV